MLRTADSLADLGRAVKRANVSLLTVGSPLRQLYARRFPDVYQWVVDGMRNGTSGPLTAELGIRQWLNRWGSADYIGRWIWEPNAAQPSIDECIGAEAHTQYFEMDQAKIVKTLASLTS
jgi:hypothetical protein